MRSSMFDNIYHPYLALPATIHIVYFQENIPNHHFIICVSMQTKTAAHSGCFNKGVIDWFSGAPALASKTEKN